MGLATWLGFSPKTAHPTRQTPTRVAFTDTTAPWSTVADNPIRRQSVEQLWRTQPHLRTVVGFVSRNIAQLGLQAFERDADDGRNRLRSGPLHDLLQAPNDDVTQFELIEATVASRMLYDETYWYVGRDINAPSGWFIRHIPTTWIVGTLGDGAFTVSAYRVAVRGQFGRTLDIPASDMIVFRGWNPADTQRGASPVEALKAVLAEQISAQVYRNQMWEKGGRVGNWIYRPPPGQGAGTSPPWAPETRQKWLDEYRENYSGDGGNSAGGTPLFEDGMELRTNRFSAKDEQFVEASKLSLSTVAQVYFVNPTMVGLLENANYANVKEFRRALYGDNLGPEIERIQQRVNAKLVPRLADASKTYCEFNLQTKLAGSFEEQSDLLQKAVGGPYMTVNEARARLNMPSVEDGDKLIVPLNVTQNGDQDPTPAAPAEPTSTLPTTTPQRDEPA